MAELPQRTIANSRAEHIADHNELHRLHDIVDALGPLASEEALNDAVTDAFAALVAGAPGALDQWLELVAAIESDQAGLAALVAADSALDARLDVVEPTVAALSSTYVHLPAATEKVVYVSRGALASDAKDGLSWGAAKATIAGAVAALAGAAGTIELGYGTHTISVADVNGNGVTLAANQHLRGQGRVSTIVSFTTALTWGVKLTGQSSSVEGMYITNSAAVTYGCGLSPPASPGSAQGCRFTDVLVNASETMTAAFALGPDFPGASNIDIANTLFDHCWYNASPNKLTHGYLLGNGTTGNVVGNTAVASGGATAQYAVTLNGSGIRWYGGDFSTNTSSDIHVLHGAGDPIAFYGTRFENGSQVVNCGYVGPMVGGVLLDGCTASAYDPPDDNTIIAFQGKGALTMLGGDYATLNGATVIAQNSFSDTDAVNELVAIGVCIDNATPYPAYNPTLRRRTIIGGLMKVADEPKPNPAFQSVIDGDAKINNGLLAPAPWYHEIIPVYVGLPNAAWATIAKSAALHLGYSRESNAAQNAWLTIPGLPLAAGTWTLDFYAFDSTNRGIYTITLVDAVNGTTVSAGTVDGYAAVGAIAEHTLSGITVAVSGAYNLVFTMATKNASSSSYVGAISQIFLRRTA